MRLCEWTAAIYFTYLLAVALMKPAWPRRRRAAILSAVSLLVVLAPLTLPDTPLMRLLRDWLPAIYLLMGYWLSGLFFVRPMPEAEARLMALDRRLLGPGGGSAIVDRLPRPVVELLELAYVGCFLFVPSGLAVLVAAGHAWAADRFWTLVLLSEYGSFAMLPWIQTRPPRTLEPRGSIDARALVMRSANRVMVNTTSIGVNTFPSGHVAGSLATAIAVADVLPAMAPPMFAIALLIAVASVLGRYHYAADAMAGVLVALAAWGIVRILA